MTTIVFLVGEGEYESHRTMRPIAELMGERLGATIVYRTPDILDDQPDFPQQSFGDLSVLQQADLLVVYTRWRRLPDAEMQHIVDYCTSGGPVLGLRTSTHAFHYPEESRWREWNDRFGREVLGSPWISHHGHSSSTEVTRATDAGHPVLDGIPESFHVRSWLYRAELSDGCTPVLWGSPVDPENEPTPSPVAWVWEQGDRRTAYTELGHPADLEQNEVQRLLLNLARWCLDAEADTKTDQEADQPAGAFGRASR